MIAVQSPGATPMRIHDWTRVEPADFHDFHQGWSVAIRTRLNQGVLPEGFYAQVERTGGSAIPDVVTLHLEPEGTSIAEEVAGALAVATAPPGVRQTARIDDRIYLKLKNRVVIKHAADKRIVAVIEIVSHGNKASERDFERFIDKAASTIEQGVHLVVLDLYPPTRRDPHGIHAAIWQSLGAPADSYIPPPNKPLTLASYSAGLRPVAYIEPTAVGDELVPMPLFLTDDRYVPLPLAESYADAFAGVPAPLRRILE